VQHEVTGERGDRGRETGEDRERRRRELAQRQELQGERKRCGQNGDHRAQAKRRRREQCRSRGQRAERQDDHGADRESQRQSVHLREPPPGPGREQDVAGPQSGRAERERDPRDVQSAEPATSEQDHADQRKRRPQPARRAPAREHGQGQRSQDLQRDGSTQRDPIDGLVEQQVHPGQGGPEGDDDGPVRTPIAAQRRAAHHEQQHGRQPQPQRHDACRADPGEQQGGNGGPELHGEPTAHHEEYGAARLSAVTGDRSATACRTAAPGCVLDGGHSADGRYPQRVL